MRMKRIRSVVTRLMIASLACGCCSMFAPPSRAASQGPRGPQPSTGMTNDRKAAEKPGLNNLNDLDSTQSEMRGLIDRYVADRGSLGRFYTVETSPARYARMKQFYGEW